MNRLIIHISFSKSSGSGPSGKYLHKFSLRSWWLSISFYLAFYFRCFFFPIALFHISSFSNAGNLRTSHCEQCYTTCLLSISWIQFFLKHQRCCHLYLDVTNLIDSNNKRLMLCSTISITKFTSKNTALTSLQDVKSL